MVGRPQLLRRPRGPGRDETDTGRPRRARTAGPTTRVETARVPARPGGQQVRVEANERFSPMWIFNRKRARRPGATAHRSRALRPEMFDRLERREVLATAAVTPFTVPAGLLGHPITVNPPVAGTPHGTPTATRVLSGGAAVLNRVTVIAAPAVTTPGGINFGLANGGRTVGFPG